MATEQDQASHSGAITHLEFLPTAKAALQKAFEVGETHGNPSRSGKLPLNCAQQRKVCAIA